MKKITLLLVFITNALIINAKGGEQTPASKRIYTTQHAVGQAPEIDGKLDDPFWQQGEWSGNFTQQTPIENGAPSENTEIKILYDDKNIYVAFKVHEKDASLIDARLGQRDQFYGDVVGICFDSYFDHRTGFEFDITAAGAKIDLILLNDNIDMSWNAVWEGKTHIGDSMWTAEMRIPLSQLRFSEQEQQTWGLHSWRWINRNNEEDQWNLIPRNNAGTLHHIGELHGIQGLKSKRRLELLPFTVAQSNHFKAATDNPYTDGSDQKINFGLDGKMGLSSNFTLDFTINPDFGQVEADPAQLNLTVFETYFDEKRPFFLEGRNIFDFNGFNMFYSRRIGHAPSLSPDIDEDKNEYADQPQNTTILGAVKVTGKTENGWSLGIMESLTQKEITDVWRDGKAEEFVAEPLTNYLVGRVQKDINNSNSMIGAIITSSNRKLNDINELTKNALTGGVDFFHHWHNKDYFVKGSVIGSNVEGPTNAMIDLQERSSRYYQRTDATHLEVDSSLTTLSGVGSTFAIGKTPKGHWSYQTGYNYRSPGLEINDLGYLTTADEMNWNSNLRYRETKPQYFYREFGMNLVQNNAWTTNGEHSWSDLALYSWMKFENKMYAEMKASFLSRGYDTRLLRGGPAVNLENLLCNYVYLGTDDAKTVSESVYYHFHIYPDATSSQNDVSTSISWKIGQLINLRASLDYSNSRDILFYVNTFDTPDESKLYFMGQQNRETMGVTLRANLSITPEMSIQYYANPYLSTGTFTNYKTIDEPHANSYDQLYTLIPNESVIYNEPDNTYSFVNDGTTYEFDNPNFDYKEFRSNLVFRWEFMPGSTFYAVWTHNRSGYENRNDVDLSDGWNDMMKIDAQNVFLLKLSYWFAI